MKCLCIFVVKC